MRDPVLNKRASERMWKIEGLFAEAKQNHCLSRAKYRGRSKVQIQAYLSAVAQSLKRLLFLLYQWLAAWLRKQPFCPTPPTKMPIVNWTFSTSPTVFLDGFRSRLPATLARVGHIVRGCGVQANARRQHGHSPSNPPA